MSGAEDVKQAAAERGRRLGLRYAGALLPAEAHDLMKAGARLIDVRTKAELHYVGRIPGAIEVEWQSWPGSRPNPEFIAQLSAAVPKDAPALFICRSGARSHAAADAALAAGWKQAYNVLEGFEGDKDPQGHRNTVNGWRKAGLPWTQT